MKVQFPGTCRECGAEIVVGDEAHYADQILTCVECGPAAADMGRGSNAGFEDAPGYVRTLKTQLDDTDARLDRLIAAFEQLHASTMTINAALIGFGTWAEKLSGELGVDPPEIATDGS